MLAYLLFSCGGSGKIETCGDLRVISAILRGGGVEIEDHRVEVKEGGLCVHRVISRGKEVPVYYAGGYYFIGVAFNAFGEPVYGPGRMER